MSEWTGRGNSNFIGVSSAEHWKQAAILINQKFSCAASSLSKTCSDVAILSSIMQIDVQTQMYSYSCTPAFEYMRQKSRALSNLTTIPDSVATATGLPELLSWFAHSLGSSATERGKVEAPFNMKVRAHVPVNLQTCRQTESQQNVVLIRPSSYIYSMAQPGPSQA